MTYYCLRLSGVPDDEVDSVSSYCFEAGASGVEESLAFTQPSLEYEAKEKKTKTHDITVYFEDNPSILVGPIQDKFPGVTATFSEEQERDWLEEWKKGFHPFRLCGDYWVVPSWMKPPPEALIPLTIDPGMAFGTGHHATTQLCSYLLAQEMKRREADSVLDVGTGTGILAMIAHLEGASNVVAIDNDPEALRVARENLNLNKMKTVKVLETPIDNMSEYFDIVVANIIDGVLLKLKPELLRTVKKGGRLILGGILLERDAEFMEEFLRESGLEVIERVSRDEWVSYTLG